MSSSLRRGALAATVAFTIAPLAACGAGFDAQTNTTRPVNASASVDDIMIQNVNLVMSEEANGPAAVSARIFNEGLEDQTLIAILLPDSGERVQLIPAEEEQQIVIPAGGSVALGGEGNPAAYLENTEAAGVALGDAQHLVFDLSATGPIELSARVVPVSGENGAFDYYGSWGPTPAPAEPEESPENAEENAEESVEGAEGAEGESDTGGEAAEGDAAVDPDADADPDTDS